MPDSSVPAASDLKRRSFLRAAFSGAVITPGLMNAAEVEKAIAGAGAAAPAGTYHEPARDIPLVQDADVIVCGAGPAGVSAAIVAARAGARVRLFEWRGCLGGVWTAGLLGYLLDFAKPGFAKELVRHMDERGIRRGTSGSSICYEPEGMKLLLEDLCVEAGVKFQYHTRVASAYREGRNLTTIVTDSKSGRQAWSAPVFIDTTGDGDLGALAGCNFEIGEAADCPCQPMSLNALLVVKDVEALRYVVRMDVDLPGEPSKQDKKTRFRQEIEKTGHFPSYAQPTLWQVRDNLVLAMMNHQYSVKPWDAAQITEATVQARAEMNKIVYGLRKLGGPWEGVQLAATAEQIGVRDGRRIMGRYTVNKEDLIQGARYDDAVARATFGVDIHATSAENNRKSAIESQGIKVKAYDIPLRALIAKDVDGLMMAGRCISGDFISHSSYRVTGNSVAMGEAAGVIAALAATSRRMPHDVAWTEGVEKLKGIGLRGKA